MVTETYYDLRDKLSEYMDTKACKWFGHPGIVFYTNDPTSSEPDWHCHRCGKYLG